MKKALLLIIGFIILSISSYAVYHQFYLPWKDHKVIEQLELKMLPLISVNDVQYYSNQDDCKQIRYGKTEAASPKGCAYKENITDDSKKSIPDFTEDDRELFTKIQSTLGEVSHEEIDEIRSEYTRLVNTGEYQEIGLGFHMDCFFCRVRYVYWPSYLSLPLDKSLEIWYSPINGNWYRVDEDWN